MPFNIQPVREFVVRPALPPALARMSTLAYNILWAWEPAIRTLFRRLDPVLWKESQYNPVVMLGRVSQTTLERAAADPRYLAQYQLACQRYDAHMQRRGGAGKRRQDDRLFFRRVRPDGMHAGLFGRSGGAFGRSHEVGERSGSAAGRSRIALPAGILPAVSECGRLATGALSRERFLLPAGRAGAGCRTASSASSMCSFPAVRWPFESGRCTWAGSTSCFWTRIRR